MKILLRSRYAADVLLRWKRLQGDEDAYLARLVRTSDSPSIQLLGQDMIERRSELSRLLHSPKPDADRIRYTLQMLVPFEIITTGGGNETRCRFAECPCLLDHYEPTMSGFSRHGGDSPLIVDDLTIQKNDLAMPKSL